jgi:Domain of unknown function (DUF2017)
VKRIKSTPEGLSLVFSAGEADLLTSVAEQLTELLDGVEDPTGDPALERLLPDAYRDNADDAAEFRRFTQAELVDEKVAGARGIAGALTSRDAKGAAHVLLDPAQAVAWLRSLNDIRLALAARLGIVDESSRPRLTDNSYAIYIWLGQVQFLLLRAVDK